SRSIRCCHDDITATTELSTLSLHDALPISMHLITNPARFDVVLTENLFGDILSDEAAAITGSLGMLASATIGGQVDLYEPVHGRSEEHTSELQSRSDLVCRLLLEKKNVHIL